MTVVRNENVARVFLDSKRVIGEISPLLFGGFAEHMGRCIYTGIYDPGSPHADPNGLRRDVLEALRELNCSVIRYPGGNFVSGYDWRDGVGPKDRRPVRRDLAWQALETNQFGTNEFIAFCRELQTEPMLAVNLGTGSIAEAANLVEYCNAPTGSQLGDLRASHGFAEPHNVHYWCLGNEMDGDWQIGHLEASEYARKAHGAAHLMKIQDPSIELVLCGSSLPRMATYPEWDRLTLETCWENVEYLSAHYYADNHANDTGSYLALTSQFEEQVDTLAATLRYVKAKNRSKHDVFLSWDEWNVSYKETPVHGKWQEAPPLVEEIFNLEDALVVAQWLSVFIRRCDVVKIACISMLLNVAGPLLTSTSSLLKQTTFYPMMLFSRHASGTALDALVLAPRYATTRFGEMPLLDVSATQNEVTGQGATFLVNRSQTEALEVELNWQDQVPARVETIHQLSGCNAKSTNHFAHPNAVVPWTLEGPPIVDGRVTLVLPPLSFTVVVTQLRPSTSSAV